MGTNCSSCGCADQGEFKTNEVALDDGSYRKNQMYEMGRSDQNSSFQKVSQRNSGVSSLFQI